MNTLLTDNVYPQFDTIEDAFDWMEEQVDDSCIDNHRFAYMNDDESIATYEEIRESGCCGSFDAEIIVHGNPAMIGCNYGH